MCWRSCAASVLVPEACEPVVARWSDERETVGRWTRLERRRSFGGREQRCSSAVSVQTLSSELCTNENEASAGPRSNCSTRARSEIGGHSRPEETKRTGIGWQGSNPVPSVLLQLSLPENDARKPPVGFRSSLAPSLRISSTVRRMRMGSIQIELSKDAREAALSSR